MTVDIATLNALPASDAQSALAGIHPGAAVITAVVAARPYESVDAVVAATLAAIDSIGDADLPAIINAYSPLGFDDGSTTTSAQWSRHEESAIDTASDTWTELAPRIEAYGKQFGYLYLVAAEGRDAGELLTDVNSRLVHSAPAELGQVRAEMARITGARIRRTVSAS